MSTIDQHDHLPVEQLADYAEGLITDSSALAVIDAHLTACGQCEQVLRDLRGVTALLQAEQTGPMPAMVAMRLDAVLAAEASERRADHRGRLDRRADRQGRLEHPTSRRAASADEPGARAMPEADVTPETAIAVSADGPPSGARPRSLSDARRRQARRVSALAAAATVAAFAIGAAIFSQNMSNSDDAGSGALAQREDARDTMGRLYAGSAPDTRGVYESVSGQSFTAYTLSATARDLLAKREGRTSSQAPLANPTPGGPPDEAMGGEDHAFRSELTTLLSPAGLSACVAQLVPDPADVQVLAVDAGTYGGEPAALLILSDAVDPAKAQVWVVGAPCGQGQSAELLRTEILRR